MIVPAGPLLNGRKCPLKSCSRVGAEMTIRCWELGSMCKNVQAPKEKIVRCASFSRKIERAQSFLST